MTAMSEDTHRPPCSPTEHCWHGTSHLLTSGPPQAEEICCYCGAKRTLDEGAFAKALIAHMQSVQTQSSLREALAEACLTYHQAVVASILTPEVRAIIEKHEDSGTYLRSDDWLRVVEAIRALTREVEQ